LHWNLLLSHYNFSMAEVVLNNLIKDYSDGKKLKIRAVNNINLKVNDQEFMVLVGPSGCGKSTTLRMIAGLEEISEGSIKIENKIVNNVLPKDRDIAMVFQNYALYPHMNVYDNMAFGLKLMKHSKLEIKKRVNDAAAILGIEDLLDRKPKALSGGQRQRVAVGRAIVRKPKVFLFDEPLSNLDAKMRVSMRTEISKLHSRLATTMIYVTHDQVEAMTMGDRITVMKDGDIMQVAEPLELYHHPANTFVAGFIGSPSMNFFQGKITRTNNQIKFIEYNESDTSIVLTLQEKESRIASTYLNKEIILGTRPEDISDLTTVNNPISGYAIQAKLEVSEPMGAETFLYLNTGVTPFVAKVRSKNRYLINQIINLNFEPGRIHFFDPKTKNVLK